MQPIDNRRHKVLIAVACTLLAALSVSAIESEPKSKKPSKSKPSPGPAEPSSTSSGLTAFGSKIPANRPNRGVYIPSFSEGKASSTVEADVLTRIDDTRLKADVMTIRLYGESSADEVTVTMPSAIYNMTNQILRSDDRSKVHRADFEIEGDSLVFDTNTSQGRMTGNVRMTINDAASLLKKPSPAAEKPVPKAIPFVPPTSSSPQNPSQAKTQP
jgi:hypothetical protein